MTTRDPLADLSADLGADRSLIQAAGGNTSIKAGGRMRIKASGKWLERAREEDIFVTVDLERLREAVNAGDADEDYSRFAEAGSRLRPSIETPLHGMLPHTVGIHVHSVDAIAASARSNSEAFLADRLDGLAWRRVPYVKPGLPLTRAMLDSMAGEPCDVFVFANHGLMIGAETVEKGAAVLKEVCRRLAMPVRPAPSGDAAALARLAAGTPYVPAAAPDIHAIATDPERLAVAKTGSLYPDHVVFLGPGLTVVDDDRPVAAQLAHRTADAFEPPAIAVAGKGVLVHADAGASVSSMLLCLSDVTGRLRTRDRPSVLTADEEAALMTWDAEAYRKTLEQR